MCYQLENMDSETEAKIYFLEKEIINALEAAQKKRRDPYNYLRPREKNLDATKELDMIVDCKTKELEKVYDQLGIPKIIYQKHIDYMKIDFYNRTKNF